jgi:hypothetical protein
VRVLQICDLQQGYREFFWCVGDMSLLSKTISNLAVVTYESAIINKLLFTTTDSLTTAGFHHRKLF